MKCLHKSLCCFLVSCICSPSVLASDAPTVTPPPEAFFQLVDAKHRDQARQFYGKYITAVGLPIVAAGEVDDRALVRAQEIVNHMLAGRPDVIRAMVEDDMYLVIIGKNQVYTDMPEYSSLPNRDFWNERVRGTGGRPTSFGEENLLSLPIDRYDDESIAVHEFAHTIDGALESMDPNWKDLKKATYQNAVDNGLYRHAYAGSNATEYWAETVQAYFDCDRANNWNHNFVTNREQLRDYDPAGYELARRTFRLSPSQDWRYEWLQTLPNVIAPPVSFDIDPYYTKFTYSREFPVVGRAASDKSMLKANHTIRNMFAYRHDVLKALIDAGIKLVVLAPNEHLADLPELKDLDDGRFDLLTRTLNFAPEHNLIVVDEHNVLGNPSLPAIGSNQIIGALAKAALAVTGGRPVDPNWNNRGQDAQQYELRVKRLDEDFGEHLAQLFATAQSEGKWKGTSAMHNEPAYWAHGVLAYFDAAGQDASPHDAEFPIRSREQLEHYDPRLFELVREVMDYEGHVDWRYIPTHQ